MQAAETFYFILKISETEHFISVIPEIKYKGIRHIIFIYKPVIFFNNQ
jgi:hypothetical protein